MNNVLLITFAGFLFGLIIIWFGVNIWAAFFPNNLACHIVGMGGISHVPANCLRYFLP